VLWRFLGEPDYDGTAPELWPEHADDPALAVAADCIPAYRVHSSMGAATLLEGFDRSEVAQVMRWHAVADEADTWDVLRYIEAEVREVLMESRRIEAERREQESERR